MTDQPSGYHYRQIASVIPVSNEIMADVVDLRRMLGGPPLTEHERRVMAERLAADTAERAGVRSVVKVVPVTVESLLEMLDEKFGVSAERAAHMVQPYCICDQESDGGGVYSCQHWDDLQKEKS